MPADEEGAAPVLKDCLVYKNNEDKEDVICLQDVVKNALRHWPKGRGYVLDDESTLKLFKKDLPDTNVRYLRYQPERNGKYRTTEDDPTIISGNAYVEAKRILRNMNHSTRYGQTFFSVAPLSKEKRAKLLEHRAEVSLNRKKAPGADCPATN